MSAKTESARCFSVFFLLGAAALLPAPAGAAPEGASRLRVHIDPPDPALVLMRSAGLTFGQGFAADGTIIFVATTFAPVCIAPCDTEVPVGEPTEYMLTGFGVPRSGPFSLASYQGDVTLSVSAGSQPRQELGTFLAAFGGAMALTGVGLLAIDRVQTQQLATLRAQSGPSAAAPAGGSPGRWGWLSLGLGVPSIVAGVVMLATSGTHVEVVGGTSAD